MRGKIEVKEKILGADGDNKEKAQGRDERMMGRCALPKTC